MFCREAEVSPAASDEDIMLAGPFFGVDLSALGDSGIPFFIWILSGEYNNSRKVGTALVDERNGKSRASDKRQAVTVERVVYDYVINSGDFFGAL
jgi:hypothetical protein